jgi:hypothetical protein
LKRIECIKLRDTRSYGNEQEFIGISIDLGVLGLLVIIRVKGEYRHDGIHPVNIYIFKIFAVLGIEPMHNQNAC